MGARGVDVEGVQLRGPQVVLVVHADKDSIGVQDNEGVEEAALTVFFPAMAAAWCPTRHLGGKVDLVIVGETAELPEKEVVVVSVVKAGLAAICFGRDELEERFKGLTRVARAMNCVLRQE